jgi:heme/copper-type cytochrome/quinol oxidase subunit 1
VRLIGRLSQPQKIVIVIALGVACVAVGTYVDSLRTGVSFGWYAYAPLTGADPFTGGGAASRTWLHGWVVLIIWLALAGLWALVSSLVLRPASGEPAR